MTDFGGPFFQENQEATRCCRWATLTLLYYSDTIDNIINFFNHSFSGLF
jgi:hypothetical protein